MIMKIPVSLFSPVLVVYQLIKRGVARIFKHSSNRRVESLIVIADPQSVCRSKWTMSHNKVKDQDQIRTLAVSANL